MSTDSELLLSKTDIAALARVQRPVVSMWVKRYRGRDRPFPDPVRVDGRQQYYRADDVVAWLASRGLGNNEAFAEDLAAHAAFEDPAGAEPAAVFAALTALLCVKAQTGEQLAGLDIDDLLDEADDLDPDDAYLYREIDALGDRLPAYAAHADRLADAAYTVEHAFETLMAQRFRLPLEALADTALSPSALEMCAQVIAALAPDDRAVFVDPSPDGSDLFVALRRRLPEFVEPTAMAGRADTPTARLARRRLAVHRWRRRPTPESGFDENFSIDGPAVFLTQYPSPATLGYTDARILTEIDNITMQMGAEHIAVIVGPASALTDPLRDRAAAAVRADLLRSDRLRAAFRLPEGLLVTRPGSSLALWVLGAPDPATAPADRWTVLADLRSRPLDAAVADGIVADITAATGSREFLRAHAFQFASIHRTSELLADDRRGLLPPAPRRRRRRTSGAETAAEVVELVVAANRAARAVHDDLRIAVEYRRTSRPLPTAGRLADAGALKVVPGNRIDDEDIEEGGDVRVIGPDELLGRARIGDRGIDRLTLATRYPSGRYTEPGDIVFCATPEFGVVVDYDGAAIVPAPARILRITDPQTSGILPELVARSLRQMPVASKPAGAIRSGLGWRDWPIPVVAPDEYAAVSAALDELRARRDAAEQLLDTLDRLTDTLTDGVGHGVLTVTAGTRHSREEG
ncbi:hypothetical protein [Rhodococcus aetherivorans]|uniref:hypothetical protein n=1 Tax=Rhodococcus aetherivorans TaxID=191292 RepID=UPI001E659465|nr:hypothetical protein [Rhodococcus aetherivorans]UGQ41871.1 hypothetical protein LRQ66_00590 [Rhodococcus aetherivorans]